MLAIATANSATMLNAATGVGITGPDIVIAVCFGLLALAHSVMGELELLKPLFSANWEIPAGPRWAVDRILRFAWHLTSIAWLGIAAHVLGLDLATTIATLSLASAALIFVMLRGHLAWPLFLLAGLAALRLGGYLDDAILEAAAVATAAVLAALGGLHVYWAAGGTWLGDKVLPQQRDGAGRRVFEPGRLLTLAVAVGLVGFACLVGSGPLGIDLGLGATHRVAIWIGVAVLAARAIGDGNYAGFTKSVRDTDFGRADDAVFTPLVVMLALGGSAAALVA